MKKTILLAAMAACLFATNVFAQKIKGSDTCLPLTQTEAENFMNKNKAAKITVTGGVIEQPPEQNAGVIVVL